VPRDAPPIARRLSENAVESSYITTFERLSHRDVAVPALFDKGHIFQVKGRVEGRMIQSIMLNPETGLPFLPWQTISRNRMRVYLLFDNHNSLVMLDDAKEANCLAAQQANKSDTETVVNS
jgi:hypothetical protein